MTSISDFECHVCQDRVPLDDHADMEVEAQTRGLFGVVGRRREWRCVSRLLLQGLASARLPAAGDRPAGVDAQDRRGHRCGNLRWTSDRTRERVRD